MSGKRRRPIVTAERAAAMLVSMQSDGSASAAAADYSTGRRRLQADVQVSRLRPDTGR